jgi:hypothetical protein
MFNSDAKQDQFVANLLNFKRNGYYLDIGSHHSTRSNNTFYFQNLDWIGICVEIESSYNSSYSNRKNCYYHNEDATKIDYLSLLRNYNFPNSIDYLSLDIDTLSLNVLSILPLNEFRFKVITIEHDSYLYGDVYKSKQREILEKNGYFLICSDVYVEQPGFNKENCSFEDWWIDPDKFDKELIDKVKSNSLYPSKIIKKFK